MTRTSQKSMARYGTPLRFSVDHEVFAALLAESKRTKRSPGHVASVLLRYWLEDIWIPTQQAKK